MPFENGNELVKMSQNGNKWANTKRKLEIKKKKMVRAIHYILLNWTSGTHTHTEQLASVVLYSAHTLALSI